jgi:hypothetical protein
MRCKKENRKGAKSKSQKNRKVEKNRKSRKKNRKSRKQNRKIKKQSKKSKKETKSRKLYFLFFDFLVGRVYFEESVLSLRRHTDLRKKS